jgi:hypothetical protein
MTCRRAIIPLFVLVMPFLGCRVFQPEMAPVDLLKPGWTIREGQAVWRVPRSGIELAGEVLVASGVNGQGYVQFTKPPFTVVVSQYVPGKWEIEFPPQQKRYAGRGSPPKRLMWLCLPMALAGQLPPKPWAWHQDQDGWRLENSSTGEALEGYFQP